MPLEGSLNSVDDRKGVLSDSGDVTPDAAEGFGPLFAAKGARDLLLNLHHADISFCQIVVEWETEVVHESQDFLSVLIESFE